jgi:hypothetical protein
VRTEPPLTAGQRAYLDAFDRWLHEVWKVGEEGEGHPAEVEKRVRLWCLVGERVATASCGRCGDEFGRRPGPGRPRKYCETCRPVRRKVYL